MLSKLERELDEISERCDPVKLLHTDTGVVALCSLACVGDYSVMLWNPSLTRPGLDNPISPGASFGCYYCGKDLEPQLSYGGVKWL